MTTTPACPKCTHGSHPHGRCNVEVPHFGFKADHAFVARCDCVTWRCDYEDCAGDHFGPDDKCQSDEELAQFLIGRADVGRNAEASRRYRLSAARLRERGSMMPLFAKAIRVALQTKTSPELVDAVILDTLEELDRLSRREGEK